MVESAPIPMGAIAALVLLVFMERTARMVWTEHDVFLVCSKTHYYILQRLHVLLCENER